MEILPDENLSFLRKGPYRCSETIVAKMAALLEKRTGKPVSMGEADEALGQLTEFFKILLEERRKKQALKGSDKPADSGEA